MTNNEMTLMIAELAAKCNVTQEEAKAALEASDWNKLTAAQALEDEKLRRMQELDEVASNCEAAEAAQHATDQAAEGDAATAPEAAAEGAAESAAEGDEKAAGSEKAGKCGKGLRNLGAHIRRLVACGNRNRFEVRRGGDVILALPVTALAILMLCAFWACLVLLAIGLFAGCRYSFNGKELGRESVNSALSKAADAAERVKKGVAEA